MSVAMFEPQVRQPIARALQRVPDAPGKLAGEDRMVLGGVSWEQYMAIDEERGADHSNPRFYYLEGQLEIMTTSLRHEQYKERLAMLLVEFSNSQDLDIFPHGHATMLRPKDRAAEPDASWCFHEEKETPDLVLEIALTSGGLPKLEIYQRFGVPEVWFWRNERLEVWNLGADGAGYDGPVRVSRCLPELDVALLERSTALPTWREARRAFQEGLGGGSAAK